MKFRNKRGSAVAIRGVRGLVEAGATVDVSDDIGASLLDQPDRWEAVKDTKPKSGEKE